MQNMNHSIRAFVTREYVGPCPICNISLFKYTSPYINNTLYHKTGDIRVWIEHDGPAINRMRCSQLKSSKVRKGKKCPAIGNARKGMKFTEEHKANLSKAKIGKPSPKKGIPAKKLSPEVQKRAKEKEYATKKKNGTLTTSRWEKYCFNFIKKYINIIFHPTKNDTDYYKLNYPGDADIFIPKLNHIIEVQGHPSHGGHPYDPSSINDIKTLEDWKEKSRLFYSNPENKNKSCMYDKMIYTWTVSDPKKRKYCKDNNITLIEIWSIQDVYDYIESTKNVSFLPMLIK